jgi:hypothetical protein
MRIAATPCLVTCALWALLCAAGAAVEEVKIESEWPWRAPRASARGPRAGAAAR